MNSIDCQVPPFLSMYDLKVGARKPRQKGDRDSGILLEWEREPVDASVLATVIQEYGISCIDEFARFVKANSNQQKDALSAIKEYVKFVSWEENPQKLLHREILMYELEPFKEWHVFGWEKNNMPDFSAIHRNWCVEESERQKLPKGGAKIYAMAAGYLKLNLSASDYVDFTGGYAAGNKAAKAALESLLAEIDQGISVKPLLDILKHTRAFALASLKEGNKEL